MLGLSVSGSLDEVRMTNIISESRGPQFPQRSEVWHAAKEVSSGNNVVDYIDW